VDQRRPRFLGLGATIAALAVIIALGLLENRSRVEVNDSARWVRHTFEVQRELALARTLLTDAETGQRGFLLTLDDAYLEPNRQAIAALPGVLDKLKELTRDNPLQNARVQQLAQLADQRLDRLRTAANVRTAADRDKLLQATTGGRGNALMIEIRKLIQSAVDEEERLLQEREARLTRSVDRRGVEGEILIAGMGLGLLAGGFILIRLNQAQKLVTVCSWSKTVEYNGEWLSFDEYLRRRFHVDITHGVSPEQYAKLMSGTSGEDLRRI